MVKGGMKYVPKEVFEELDRIRTSHQISKESECFKKMVENSRIGREIRFTIDLNIGGKRRVGKR